MEYIIREMREDDWNDVAHIYEQGINSNIATVLTVCPTYEEWDASHIKPCRLVICEKEQVIGWAAFMLISRRPAYAGMVENSIYIDMHKQHQGAGRALLQELVKRSEQNGIWSIQAVILRENHPSIRLHEACGFRIIGYRERAARDRFGIWRDSILMERRSPLDIFK